MRHSDTQQNDTKFENGTLFCYLAIFVTFWINKYETYILELACCPTVSFCLLRLYSEELEKTSLCYKILFGERHSQVLMPLLSSLMFSLFVITPALRNILGSSNGLSNKSSEQAS
jgi:hypothetical protein